MMFWRFSALLALVPSVVLGFSPMIPTPQLASNTNSALHAFDPASSLDLLNTAQSLWVATIDSDIANIPTNEFATVFAGGIGVMVGGLISVIIVGTLVEKGDLYANLAAESYIQSADDKEFWKNLSEDEKRKAELMLSKIKEGKEKGIVDEKELQASVMAAVEGETPQATTNSSDGASTERPSEKKAVAKASSDMFSDYD